MGGREPARDRLQRADLGPTAQDQEQVRGRVEVIEPGAVAEECGPLARREPAPEAVAQRVIAGLRPRAAPRPAAAPSGGSRPCGGGAHDPASGVSRPTPTSSARRRASSSVVSLTRTPTDTRWASARARAIEFSSSRVSVSAQLQDALQIRARAEPLQAVGAPDRPLAPAAQPPQPARLGGVLAGLGRVPEALAALPQGRRPAGAPVLGQCLAGGTTSHRPPPSVPGARRPRP